jgi:signal transduction histidine kinase
MALATALAVIGVGVGFELDTAGWVDLDWRWCLAFACVAVGCGLLAVARRPTAALYAGALERRAELTGPPAWVLRSAVVITAPLAGFGVAAYSMLALLQALDAPRARLIDWRRSAGIGLVCLAAVIAMTAAGYMVGGDDVLWSVLLAGSGLSLFWWLPDRTVETDPDLGRTVLWVLALGLAVSAALFVLGTTGLFGEAGSNVTATAAAIAVLALIVGPRWLRTSRALALERLKRARATERAELGGMVHDSVLQTLALIQDRADDPTEVVALARRQERELRTWLLDNRLADGPPRSIATALRAVAAQVEDAHKVKIDVVTVGDAPLDDHYDGLIGAAREALVNAAKHAPESPISLFGEIGERRVAAYVRDRGPGFDLDDIPEDRRGVRDSIFARMIRNGGHAAVRTAPGGGCEVQLVQERRR